jgi:rhodanese-related sulfurtransferase
MGYTFERARDRLGQPKRGLSNDGINDEDGMIAFFKALLGLNGPGIERISPQEAKARMANGAIILDVRTPLERRAASIPGSKAVPLNELPGGWQKLPSDREIICQCASGNRSASAARFLTDQGLKASNLAGGIAAWRAAGLPVRAS